MEAMVAEEKVEAVTVEVVKAAEAMAAGAMEEVATGAAEMEEVERVALVTEGVMVEEVMEEVAMVAVRRRWGR